MLNINITEQDNHGVNWEIPVNQQFEGVKILSISQYVPLDPNDSCGDLAVNWSTDGLSNDPSAATMGSLLLRNIHSKDDVTPIMGKFYWEHGWDQRLKAILTQHGFSADAANQVGGSEWGMQDPGRASYDADEIGNEVRAHMAVTA